MRLVDIAFIMALVVIFMCGVLYASFDAQNNLIRTEDEISAIIDSNPNMTVDQKAGLISIMCENGVTMPETVKRCKDALFLKHMGQR